MTRRTYTPEYKAKLVIEVLQGEKELNTIAAENSISPNTVSYTHLTLPTILRV